jgi:hypothetical protein
MLSSFRCQLLYDQPLLLSPALFTLRIHPDFCLNSWDFLQVSPIPTTVVYSLFLALPSWQFIYLQTTMPSFFHLPLPFLSYQLHQGPRLRWVHLQPLQSQFLISSIVSLCSCWKVVSCPKDPDSTSYIPLIDWPFLSFSRAQVISHQ